MSIPFLMQFSDTIFVGGQPHEIHFEDLKELGVETVINIKGYAETPDPLDFSEKLEDAGFESIHFPIENANDVSFENAEKLQDLIDEKEKSGKVLIHCESGNRVGALIALHAFEKKPDDVEAAIESGKRACLTKMETFVRKLLTERLAE